MRARSSAAIALAALLAGCGGGSGGSGQPVAPINAPFVPSTGTVPISFAVAATSRPASASASARAPRYVSPGTASVAVYDGATLIYVANVTGPSQFTTVYANTATTSVVSGTCTGSQQAPTCTLTLQTSIGAHTFGLVTYPVPQSSANTTTAPTFAGVILAEGQLTITVVAGANPPQTIVPLGVADQVFFSGPVLTQRLNGTGPLVGIIGTTYTIQYAVDDSAPGGGYQIVQPGDYDNGPVTIAETDGGGIVTMTPISQSTPPASPGLQSFSVTCANSGTATITAAAKSKPNATYASGLTYSANNYPTGTIGTTTLQCVPGSATIPVTVQ